MQPSKSSTVADILGSIALRGSEGKVDELFAILPSNQHNLVTRFAMLSDVLIKMNNRRAEKLDMAFVARNALITTMSDGLAARLHTGFFSRIRLAAEDPTEASLLDDLHSLLRSIACPKDLPAVEAFLAASLLSGHATMACRVMEHRVEEARLELSRALGI